MENLNVKSNAERNNESRSEKIGESKTATNGMVMTIIAYRNWNDIDVQFEDGTIVEHKSYSSFLKGGIKNPNLAMTNVRLGETRKATNGLNMTIVAYRRHDDMDVMFEDGTIIANVCYFNFKKGNIALPGLNISRYKRNAHIGEKAISSSGLEMEIVEYNSSKDIDVRFPDGSIAKHKNYATFKRGEIAHPEKARHMNGAKDRVGQTAMSKDGMMMKIIQYRSYRDIDVEFEDGTIVCNRDYQEFCSGGILRPKECYVGTSKMANNGLEMKLVAYRNYDDVDVEFEDGTLVQNVSSRPFFRANLGHPNISSHGKIVGKMPTIRDIKITERAYIHNDTAFFFCECQKCLTKSIMSIGEMKQHVCKEIIEEP